MPKIIKLGELLPEDFLIEDADGTQYTLPGDPPLDLILMIAELFERTENANGDAEQVGMEVLRELDTKMVELLRLRDPAITSSPFGVLGVQHVVATLLNAYNFGVVEGEDADEDPPQATRSKRSSGSPSSSTRSASRRTTGATSAGRSSKRGSA